MQGCINYIRTIYIGIIKQTPITHSFFSGEVLNILTSALIICLLIVLTFRFVSLSTIFVSETLFFVLDFILKISKSVCSLTCFVFHGFWESSILVYLIIVLGISSAVLLVLLYQFNLYNLSFSPVIGDLGYFEFFAFINSAGMNIGGYASLHMCECILRLLRVTEEWD